MEYSKPQCSRMQRGMKVVGSLITIEHAETGEFTRGQERLLGGGSLVKVQLQRHCRSVWHGTYRRRCRSCCDKQIKVGEVGELSEIFQWKGEVPKGLPDWNAAEKEHLGEELSDVLLYLVRLADICGVDLGEAALRKVKKNGLKYPIERCKGSSKKYTHYNNVVNVEDLRVDKL